MKVDRKEPKVYITFRDKNNKIRKMYGLAVKIRKRLSVSFSKRATLGSFKSFRCRVFYGFIKNETIFNEMDCKNYSDLKYALDSFLDKDLWLEKEKAGHNERKPNTTIRV